MFRNHLFLGALAFLCTMLSAGAPQAVDASTVSTAPVNASPQQLNFAPPQTPQITQTINNAIRLQLVGNTDSSLVSGADLGTVADGLPLDHMWLQLRRSAASEQALEQQIDAMHDPKSPSFHQWLSASQFGALYGPAQSDINTVVAWLESQGFTVDNVFPSGMVIEFSGTAGNVRTAFETQLHNYNVDGVTYLSNATDPSIPTALSPVVVGVVSLNNHFPHSLMRKRGAQKSNSGNGMAKALPAIPDFTFTDPTDGTFYAVAPADFNTIYNVGPVWSNNIRGLGQTIVVIEDTNIKNASDVTTFRSAFGLSGFAGTFSQVHPTGTATCTNPGVNGAEGEAALDAEWAGVAAPDAAIELASCGDTATMFGGIIAANNLMNGANPPKIMSVSYGECESQNGAAANAQYVTAWQEAAALGISVFVSSGDEGAASCDANRTVATHGIAVSGFASTPYNIAVGGTDFLDTYNSLTGGSPLSTYWNATNTAGTFASALSYIPETPWDDSCATSLLYTLEGYTAAYGSTGFCNSTTGKNFRTTGSGSGGPSNFSAKPSWQAGVPGIVADSVRDIPDVSLFAANGLWSHFLVYCLTDTAEGGATCDYTNSTDTLALAAGGTSFAAPALAGIQALINQSTGTSWGNMNTQYYPLAATEYNNAGLLTSCNSSNGPSSGNTCVFHDVTKGDIDVNCTGTTSCFGTSKVGTTTYQGVLSTSSTTLSPAYPATSGWDFATGLGSVNVANLVAAMTTTAAYKLAFTVEPSASYASNAAITVKVSVENFSGTVLTGNTSAVTLSLSGGTAGASLGGTKTVNAVAGVATFNNLTLDKVGTNYVLNATDGSLMGAASTGFNITAGAPSKIAFTTQPSNTTAGASITPAIVVNVQDAAGNVVSGDGITLTIANNPGSSTLTGGGSVNTDSSGNATFAGVSLNKVGTGYTLKATDSSGTPLTATSGAFNITVGTASAISFSTQPSNVAAGANVTPAIVAHVQDASGNAISGDSVTLTNANNAGGSTLTGGGAVNTDVSGNATFSAVSLNKVGVGYTLTAKDSSATPLSTTSNAFNVTAGAAATLTFTTQPSGAAAGVSIAPAIVVHAQDTNGNAVSGDGITLTMANNPGGSTLSGGSSVSTNSSGDATFSAVSLNKVGSGYTLKATDSSSTPLTVTSNAFNITAGAPAAISFATQPSNAVAGVNIAPAIVVHVQDASGNSISGDSIALAIANNAGGSTLTGGGAVATDSSGNATFGAASLNKSGTGYTLTAKDSSATPLTVTSSAFNISAAAAATITFTTQPASNSNQIAGVGFALIANVTDQFGNAVQGDTVTLAIGANPSSSALTAGTNPVSTDSNGTANFGNVSLNKAGTGYTLIASDAAAPAATTNAFNVVAATAASISFSVQPSNAVAGVANNPAIVATVVDALGNPIAGDAITLSIASGPTGATLSVTNPQTTDAGGNATFADAVLATAGTYTLKVTDGSAIPLTATSASFNISAAAAAAVTFSVQPSDTTAGVAITPAVQVSLVDAFGNLETGDSTHTVTLTLAAGTDPSFSGGNAITLTNGVATFASIELTKAASGYKLSASTDAGAFTATSDAFTVTPGAVVGLAFNPDPPSDTVAGVAIPGTETVTESDQFGNVVTTDNTSTISIVANGPGSLTTSPATATVAGGIASFSGDLILDKAGSYTLTASTSVSALASVDSQSFTVSAASGNVLQFTPAPADILIGQSLGNVTVTEFDSFGNQVASDNSTSITLTAGSCGGTVVGTGMLTGGAVTIDSTLAFHTPANGVSLSATAAGSPAPTAAMSTFNVGINHDFVFFNGFEGCSP